MGAFSKPGNSASEAADRDTRRADAPEATNDGEGDGASNVGIRVQEIVDTAARVASTARAEAEAEAVRYLKEKRLEAERERDAAKRELARLSESLMARAGRVERQLAGLLEEIQEATAKLERLAVPSPEEAAPASASPLEALAALEGSGAERPPEQAVRRAAEMVDAGNERSDIEQMLRVGFGVNDPAAVVDELLSGRA